MVAIVASAAAAQQQAMADLAGERGGGGGGEDGEVKISSAQLYPTLSHLAVVAVTGVGNSSSLSSLSNHGSSSSNRPQLSSSSSPTTATATTTTSSHRHHHHHNSIGSQNSSSLANLCLQTSVQPASSKQISSRQQVASIKRPQNLNPNTNQYHLHHHHHQLPSPSRLNWRNSSSTLAATTRTTPSGLHHQAIRLHRKSLIAQQRAAEAASGDQFPETRPNISSSLLNCHSSSNKQLVHTSHVPSSSLGSRTSYSASVREALVSSRSRQAASKLSNHRQLTAAATATPTTSASASVTNSLVRQGALYARRQYPHPTPLILSPRVASTRKLTNNSSDNPPPSATTTTRFYPHHNHNNNNHHHQHQQLLRSTESSQSLVQLDCRGTNNKNICHHHPSALPTDRNRKQHQQTISKASSRFSLNSSTSSLSLAVVKRAKPSPQQQVKSAPSNHFQRLSLCRLSSLARSKSPTPIRTRGPQASGPQMIGSKSIISSSRRGSAVAGLHGSGAGYLLCSAAVAHQPHTLANNIGNASVLHGTVGGVATETTRASRSNQNDVRETTATNHLNKCKQNQPAITKTIINPIVGNTNININNIANNDDNNLKLNQQQQILGDRISLSNTNGKSSSDRVCLRLSPKATATSTERPTSTPLSSTDHAISRLPVVNNNNNNLSRGPELGSRKASISSPTFFLGPSSGLRRQIDKSNNMISSNNQQQQPLNASNTNLETRTNCDDDNAKGTIIGSNIMQKRQTIDSQPIKANFSHNNNNNHSQLPEKITTIMNDKNPLGLHQSSNQNGCNGSDNDMTKQTDGIKFHQVPADMMMAQPDSLEQQLHASDENQPPLSQPILSEHLIITKADNECSKSEHENSVDNLDQKSSIIAAAAQTTSAEREIVAVVDELNNCYDARSEAGSTDDRSKTMDYQEEVDEHVEAPSLETIETQTTRVVANRYPSSISMQRSDSLESNLESVEDQMVLGSPLVTPPPSELDVDLGEDNMIERGETSPPSSIELAQSELLRNSPPTKTALKQMPNDIIIMRPLVDIPIKQECICDFYDLEARPFARGKFAQVKRCVNKISQKCFAAKCIKKRRRSTDVRHEILLEIEALKLSYYTDCIVKLYEVYETATEMILVLEMANGGELQRVLDDEESINEKLVKEMVRQILNGLILLHDSNIAHLDIKPQNLLLTETFPNGDIKLCDFGISRRITKECEIREICGTPDYVAPEILRYDPISLATDMWSLGVLTYVLLTGYSPFGSDSKQQTFCNITQAKLDFPSEIFDKISQGAIDFMQKLIVREPADRLTSRQARVHPWLSND